MKTKTRDQVEAMKSKAVRFVDNVLGDPDRADKIDDESVDDYAERKRIQIVNPTRRLKSMRLTAAQATRKLREQAERIQELEGENQELEEKLDTIYNVFEDDDSEEEDEEEDEE